MKPRTSLVILLFGLFAFTGAYAQEGPLLFEEIDLNHDGEISLEEAGVRMDLANNFGKADKNGNGSLSVDEYSDFHNKGRLVPEVVEIPEPGSAPVD